MPAMSNKKSILFFIGISILIFIGQVAFADGLVPCGGIDDPCGFDDFFELINNILATILPIINAVAFLLMVWAGINIIWAQGDESKVRTGKNIILSVAIGILIIYGAKFITTSFVKGLGGNTNWFDTTIQMPQENK